jgi:antitoxin YefM
MTFFFIAVVQAKIWGVSLFFRHYFPSVQLIILLECAIMYRNAVQLRRSPMDTVSVNQFRSNMKNFIEQAASEHVPLKVTRRSGGDFVVISAEDWERDQETLYILQNSSLMRQIAESARTHGDRSGYAPKDGEINEILGV